MSQSNHKTRNGIIGLVIIFGVVGAIGIIAAKWHFDELASSKRLCETNTSYAEFFRNTCIRLGVDVDSLPGIVALQEQKVAEHNQWIDMMKKERLAFVALCDSDPQHYRENFKRCFDAKEFGWYSNDSGGIFVK